MKNGERLMGSSKNSVDKACDRGKCNVGAIAHRPKWANDHLPMECNAVYGVFRASHIKIRFFAIIFALIQILCGALGVRAEDIRLPKGTQLSLRLDNALSTATNMEGDEFTATVVTAVYLGDRIVIPKGSVVTGSVSRILRVDRLKGKAVLDLMFQSIRVPGYKPGNISASLTRIDFAGSDAKQPAGKFTEREKTAVGTSGTSGATGTSDAGNSKVRSQSPAGKSNGGVTSGGIPSVYNSQGDDAKIPRGASIEITLNQPLILVSQ
jgi:hypothetical protein